MSATGSARASRWASGLILGLTSLVGLAAFFYPFLDQSLVQSVASSSAHSQDAPLMTIVLIVLCLGAVMTTLSGSQSNSKMVALLGVLSAANAVLRAVPGPAGFSAVFMLPVLCGYVFGPTFGFLLGALSLLVSAMIGAGIGPWLPFQMFAVGWVGLTSGWLPRMRVGERLEVLLLGVWGLGWGLVFGALINIWFWPYVFQAQQAEMYWQPGMGLIEALQRYGTFYAVTSLWWDLGRGLGNAVLIWLFGVPLLKLFRRYQRRFFWKLEGDTP